MLEKIYRFLVYNLPCSFPDEVNKPAVTRKRKSSSHSEEISASFLTPAVSHSAIILNPHPPPSSDDNWNCNLNNSNTFLKSFLSMRHGSRGSLTSCSPSPVHFDIRGDSDRPPPTKIPLFGGGDLPKIGRPRSKSTADRPKKKATVHSRARSIDPSISPGPQTTAASTPSASTVPDAVKLNSNNSNSNCNSASSSPTKLLQIPYTRFRPLPVTPPRNPFEGSGQKLNPKTLKQLQRK